MSADQPETAVETVRAYYRALRDGDPLGPFFADEPGSVKFGISERLTGYDEIVAGLADQSATTTDWTVESHDLTVTERDTFGWYYDDVELGWVDTDSGQEYEFDTRWSGALREDGNWEFVTLHVSTAEALD